MYSIKIYNNLEDIELKKGWIKLQLETNAYPQLYYEWIAPWWEANRKNKQLYIITIKNNTDSIIGIAPFCIVKKIGFKLLQSVPIHFGDFFGFLVQDNDHEITRLIIKHVNSFNKWSYIKMDLVRDSSSLYSNLEKNRFKKQHIENIIEAHFNNISFDDYLMLLNRKVRGEYRRRLRKLEELGSLKFKASTDFNDYLNFEKDFKRIYELRWKDIDKKMPSDRIYEYRREALNGLNRNKKAIFVLLLLDNKLIAYRFGIIHNQKYHDYKISFDPKFHKLGLGSILTGLLIDELIKQGINTLDHGVGDYSYKEDWSPNSKKIGVFTFHKHNSNPLSIAYFKFNNEYKFKIKKLLGK